MRTVTIECCLGIYRNTKPSSCSVRVTLCFCWEHATLCSSSRVTDKGIHRALVLHSTFMVVGTQPKKKNDPWWWTLPWRTGRDVPGKTGEGLLPSVHLVLWIVLRHDFVFPSLNTYIQFIRHAYSCWTLEHSYRTQSGERTYWMLFSVYPESGYGFLPCLPAFLDIIDSICQAVAFKLVCHQKVLEKGLKRL